MWISAGNYFFFFFVERFLPAAVFDCVTRFLLDLAVFLFLAVRLAVDFLPRVVFFFAAGLALGDAFFLVFDGLVVEVLFFVEAFFLRGPFFPDFFFVAEVFDFVDFLPAGLPNAFSQLLEYLVVVPEWSTVTVVYLLRISTQIA